ncbi:efflux RND transporter periplasmic adaptor subunit [Pseudomonas sp.]|uniref:efflux RND transporter periplasmic adaptor subunit n=1 Tax=Pseudomonas sp. TaxID=306 RepID=UPI00272BA5B8|nr:HlyD family efflux transporter periplasmic adaptor subunit [Pseudomonas sp.]
MTPTKQHVRILTVFLFSSLLIIALWLSVARQPADTLPDIEPPEVVSEEPPPRTEARGSHRAQLVPLDSSRITAPTSGVLASWPVAQHESVAAGQLLASIATPDQNARLARLQARAGVARHQVRTLRHLVADGYEPQANLDQAQARLDAALAEIAELEASMESGRILAPAEGVVQELLVEEGAAVEAGDVIAMLAAPGPRALRSTVPAGAAEGIGPGHAARVVFGSQSLDARVMQVRPAGPRAELHLELAADSELPAEGAIGELFLHP